MSAEITVVLKNAERTDRQKFLVYEQFCWDSQDPVLSACIKQAIEKFKDEVEDVIIQAKMVLK
jgi:hypothetical protein